MKTLSAALLLLTACHLPDAAAPTPSGAMPTNLVLRAYDVPGESAQQVRAVLKDVFWLGSDGKDSNKFIGRSEVGPDGRLVVMASAGVQDGVKALIESMGSKPTHPAVTLETTYWVVLAVPGKSGAVPAGLQEVAPALQQIEKSDGPQEFTLSEKLALTQLSGESARVNGRDAEFHQLAQATSSGTISTELAFSRSAQRIETRVNVKPGQTVVLGSSGAPSKEKDGSPVSLYLLMRSGIHDGTK